MLANIFFWIARGIGLALFVSLVMRNAKAGTTQALPVVMGVILIVSFIYPLVQRNRR